MRTTLKIIGVSVAIFAVLMVAGCLTDPDESTTPKVTISTNIGTVQGGSNKPVDGEITAGGSPITISIKILDSDGNEVPEAQIDADYTTPPTNKDKIDLENDLALTIKASQAACAGDYTLEIKATYDGQEATATKAFTVTGLDCSEPALTAKTGTVYNRCGKDKGAYDLVNGVLKGASDGDAQKDIRDSTTTCGEAFDAMWASLNGTKFSLIKAADAAQYTQAGSPPASVVAGLGASANSNIIGPIEKDDVVIAKLGGSRGYALIVIDEVDPNGAMDATSANKGSISFTYYFTDGMM